MPQHVLTKFMRVRAGAAPGGVRQSEGRNGDIKLSVVRQHLVELSVAGRTSRLCHAPERLAGHQLLRQVRPELSACAAPKWPAEHFVYVTLPSGLQSISCHGRSRAEHRVLRRVRPELSACDALSCGQDRRATPAVVKGICIVSGEKAQDINARDVANTSGL